ncbi:MAG: aminopeptidase [Chloroflexota bacterium]
MSDPRIDKLAKVLVNYSVEIKAGDWVRVGAHVLALPAVTAVVREVIHAGGHVTVQLSSDELEETILREASEDQLKWVSPLDKLLYERVDVLISIGATNNTRGLTSLDPKRQQITQIARKELTETYLRRSAEGSLRWVGTQFPCSALAQDAEMSLREYEDFVYAATFVDQPDPIAKWQEIHNEQQRLVEWLKGKKTVEAQGPNVDLKLSIQGHTFINADGKKNMPSGEIFTGPVEDSVNGWIRFTYPAIRAGREVEGVTFKFKDGKVAEATAEKNEAYLISQLDSDPGARYLGEFAIGTNFGITRFTKSILFDEKIGGTMHLAVGAGYPETGSENKSSIHWDFICDMRKDSEIRVDGDLFYKNGKFCV